MVRAGRRIVVRREFEEAFRASPNERERRQDILGTVIQIVRDAQARKGDRLRTRVINFKPVVQAGYRIGQPLVDAQQRGLPSAAARLAEPGG